MRRLFSMILGVAFGAAFMWFAFSVHVVRHDGNWHFVPRQKTQLTDFYSDVSRWDATEWNRHRELKDALIQSGHALTIPELKLDQDVLLHELRRHIEARREDQPRRR